MSDPRPVDRDDGPDIAGTLHANLYRTVLLLSAAGILLAALVQWGKPSDGHFYNPLLPRALIALAATGAAALSFVSPRARRTLRVQSLAIGLATIAWFSYAALRHGFITDDLFGLIPISAGASMVVATWWEVVALPLAIAIIVATAHAFVEAPEVNLGVALIILSAICGLIGSMSAWRHHLEERLGASRRALAEEKRKSDRLLADILPQSVADRLKAGGREIADGHASVTVLFADLANFTSFADGRAPQEVVQMLSRIFTAFDEIAARHGIEKIKTIGDAYMAVAGLPEPHPDHAAAAAAAALEMRGCLRRLGQGESVPVEMRIGLYSGPVVAGVIGQRKFAYDLWGDTVNSASRMESHGVTGEIQVGETTYALLRERAVFRERGVIDVKGKGPMKAYLLDRLEHPAHEAAGPPDR